MNIERGIQIRHKKLSAFHRLFEEWFLIIERYCNIYRTYDLPYFYNERANIGLISAAAWRCGWLSLEEFQLEKRRGRKKGLGRCDLWLFDGKMEYYCEGKFAFLSARSKQISQKIKELQIDALKYVKKIFDNEDELKLAIMIICPFITINNNNIEKNIENFIKELINLEPNLSVWCFPKSTREFLHSDNKRYPGVAISINLNQ